MTGVAPPPTAATSAWVLGCGGQHDHLNPSTGHCYRYSDNDGSFGTWQDANGFCMSWGGHLLVLNDEAERSFIASLMGTLAYGGTEFLWVGARDPNSDGDYNWLGGGALPSGSPWWASTPPDGGCAAIMPRGASLVASEDCSGADLNTYHLHHACEREPEGQLP